MAVTLDKTLSIRIGDIVDGHINSFVTARDNARVTKEANFYRQVIANGLSTEDQIEFYNGWISDEKDKSVTDSKFVDGLKTNVEELKRLRRAEKFYDAYRISFEDLKTADKSISDHIQFLESELGEAVDQDLTTNIKDLLSITKQDKFTIQNNILNNQVQLALNDKRVSVLNDAINKVDKERNKALLAGNDEIVSMFDLKLQSLNSQLQTSKINDAVHQMDVDMTSEAFTPVGFFERLEDNLNKAEAGNAPITINGTRYSNAREYWQLQMSQYIEKNFFALQDAEIKNKIDTANAKLSPVLQAEIEEQNSIIDGLKDNSNFAPYLERLDSLRTSANVYGVDKLGQKIVRDYQAGKLGDTASANINNAITRLTNLNTKYGIDVSANINTVIQDVAGKKTQIASKQIKIIQDEMAKGKTFEEASQIAQESVSAIDVPATDVLKTEPIDIATRFLEAPEKRAEGEPDPADITQTKVETEQPRVSGEEPAPVIEKGEQISSPELLSLLKETDIVREGENIFLKSGVTAPFQKVSSPEELAGLKEEQLVRPKGTEDIFKIL